MCHGMQVQESHASQQELNQSLVAVQLEQQKDGHLQLSLQAASAASDALSEVRASGCLW